MVEQFFLNTTIKSSVKPDMWLKVITAKKSTSDYIIEYKIIFENEKGEKIKNDNFTRKTLLSDFAKKERNFITQLIKLGNAVNNVRIETTIID